MPNLDKIKETLNKIDVYYDSDMDYLEAWDNLVCYFDILIQMDSEQKRKSEDTTASR
jgi:hypothetical protein